jgi:hypothetical protein
LPRLRRSARAAAVDVGFVADLEGVCDGVAVLEGEGETAQPLDTASNAMTRTR